MTHRLPRIITAAALALSASAVAGCSSSPEPSDEAFCTASDQLDDQIGLITIEVDGLNQIVTGATGDGDQADVDAIRETSENLLTLIEPAQELSDTAKANVRDPEVAKAVDDLTLYTLKIVRMMAEEGLEATSVSDFLDGVASHPDLEEELNSFDGDAASELVSDYREETCE